MNILTWNINGIRAVTGKSGVAKLLESLHADVICLQETKVTRDMLDEPTAIVDGFESYFSFSRRRTGYSGTASYCTKRCCPVRAEEGLTGRLTVDPKASVGCYGNMSTYSDKDLEALDAEGRCVITQHRLRLASGAEREVAIINVYVPRAGDRPERLVYKLKFLTLLRSRARALLRRNIHVIILGDLNLTHRELDNCDPKSDADFLRRSSRVWINNLLQSSERDPGIARVHPDLIDVALPDNNSDTDDEDVENETDRRTSFQKKKKYSPKPSANGEEEEEEEGGAAGFSDVYRRLHPDVADGYTNWDTSTDARKSNYGRRLDYILVDTGLAGHVTDCRILAEVEGSDHCPVMVTLDCQTLPNPESSPPQLCSKLMPEFRGQQQKLSSFFKKAEGKSSKADDASAETLSSSQGSIGSSQEELATAPATTQKPLQLHKSSSTPASPRVLSPKKQGLKRSVPTKSASSVGPSQQKKAKQQLGPKQASLASFFSLKQTKAPSAGGSALRDLGPFQVAGSAHQASHSRGLDKEDVTVICVDKDEDCVNSRVYSNPSLATNKTTRDGTGAPGHEQSGGGQILEKGKDMEQRTSNKSPDQPGLGIPAAAKSVSLTASAASWKSLLSGPAPAPLCPGHKEPCVLKTVRKNGPNKNKQFYSCPRPDGPPGNPQYRCNFFQWLHDRQKKKT